MEQSNITLLDYKDIANYVSTLIEKETLNEDEKNLISLFAINYCNRNFLHTNNLASNDDIGFNIVSKASRLNTIGSKILLTAGNNEYQNRIKEQSNNSGMTKAYVRQLKSDNYSGSVEEDYVEVNEMPQGINGFTSILLILLITIAVGLFLASVFV